MLTITYSALMLLLTNTSSILCFGHSAGTQVNALIATAGVFAKLVRPAHTLPALIYILFKKRKEKKARVEVNSLPYTAFLKSRIIVYVHLNARLSVSPTPTSLVQLYKFRQTYYGYHT